MLSVRRSLGSLVPVVPSFTSWLRERRDGTSHPYEPRRYWSERLRRDFSLAGAGYQRLGTGMNHWVYRQRLGVLRRLLVKHHIDLHGKRVAEMGVGTGYWIREWKRMGASHVFGIDVAPISIDFLRRRYPDDEFAEVDLGAPGAIGAPAHGNKYEFIAAMEVLLHIMDDRAFSAALDNIAALARAGTWLLISDLFLAVEARGFHCRSRTLALYRRELAARGFELVERVPVFFLLHPTEFELRGARRRIAMMRWYATAGLVWLVPAAGWGLGLPLYLVDSAWSRIARQGRSTHLTLWRRA